MDTIDSFLNRVTPYRLVRNGLWLLVGVSFIESFFRMLDYTPIEILVSAAILVLAARVTTSLCVLFTRATPAPESGTITALILFCILSPIQSAQDALVFIAVAVLAVVSRYVFVYQKRAIFNAAAIGVFAASVAGSSLVTWWVSAPVLAPFVAGVGFLILRKTRSFDIFGVFVVAVLLMELLVRSMQGVGDVGGVLTSLFSTFISLLFVGAFMLTDPHTMPTERQHRRVYAGMVGVLFPLGFMLGPVGMSPELAVLVGNVYAFLTTAKKHVVLTFHAVERLSKNAYEFVFVAAAPVIFLPGHHAEITAAHTSADKRGTRRSFVFVSAPSDTFIRFATTIPVESSTFKDTLSALKKGAHVLMTGPQGGLMFPRNPSRKLLFIAAGIGITPFMSLFRELVLRRARRDVVLIYTAKTPLDFAYQKEIDSIAELIGLKVLYVPVDFSELVGWDGPSGYLTQELIETEIRDAKQRLWYIAGPQAEVQDYERFARKLGIPKAAIKAEPFPGF